MDEVQKLADSLDSDALEIKSETGQIIFRITQTGVLYGMIDGELREIKVDKDLTKAFVYLIADLSGYATEKYVEKIKELEKELVAEQVVQNIKSKENNDE